MQRGTWVKLLSGEEQLFVSLADGVSHTMLQLATLSESAQRQTGKTMAEWQAVEDLTRSSLQLLEGYTLTMRLQGGSAEPELEAISVGSLLGDTLQALEPFAKQLSVPLELDISSRMELIYSDRAIVQSALVSLGQVFVTALSEMEDDGIQSGAVRLSAHRTAHGIVTGWYSQGLQLTTGAFARARKLGGWAQQPYSELVSGPAAGVFIADSLLSSVASKLHVARYHNAMGLAATLPTCQQLRLGSL